jgi:hypothetical protein
MPTLFDEDPLKAPGVRTPYDGHAPSEPKDRAGTSFAAAVSIEPHAGTLRAEVLSLIRDWGKFGRTDDEIEMKLGLRHQTASARRRELVLAGLIVDSGRKRATRSGRMAVVWVAK